jgi:hypothetical protein
MYTKRKESTTLKHNISITMDQKLFREIENTRGREKRSTYIEYLIIQGLKAQKNKKEEIAVNDRNPHLAVLQPLSLSQTKH